MNYPILYSLTSNGLIQQWQIEVSGARFRTHEGIVDGVITTSEWTTCKSKNVGRANETSASEQAAREAASRHQRKLDKGYTGDKALAGQISFFKPMLAHDYADYCNEIEYPVYSQSKLDGMRCIATAKGLFSRNGKSILTAPHVVEALRPLFTAHPDLVLDGELYNHALNHDFNRLMSLAKKTKPTAEDLVESRALEYWVYDAHLGSDVSFGMRDTWLLTTLSDLDSPHIKYLTTKEVPDQGRLDELYETYLAAGYEGQMIRADSSYENKRTKALLKRKEWHDAEFEIVDLQEGRGGAAGMVARAVLKTKGGHSVRSGHDRVT